MRIWKHKWESVIMSEIRNNNVSFCEVQQFRQVWLWVLNLSTSVFLISLFGYGMLKQLVFGHSWGSKPMSDTGLAIAGSLVVLLGIGLLYFFYVLKLVTEVRSDGLYIRFSPLTHQKICFKDIVYCEVRTYNPITEYGGLGIRYGRKGKAYNVSGNRGVQLELSNGKRLLIGSQRSEELAKAIQQILGQ